MRGEYAPAFRTPPLNIGSPPHAWGILPIFLSAMLSLRFTPTCVGNTSLQDSLSLPPPVHPHMRGEYVRSLSHWLTYTGSPPHAWGIRRAVSVTGFVARFTPTCVGNTFDLPAPIAAHSVHPHMRGEYAGAVSPALAFCGSPPHAWGIRAD